MPLIKQKFIFRQDLQDNPDVLYLFGDNDKRVGNKGQAREMRDEENAVGVRTKWSPGRGPGDYFSDDEFDEVTDLINKDLDPVRTHLEAGKTVVLPTDGLGTGLSKLSQKAPLIHAWLVEQLQELETL